LPHCPIITHLNRNDGAMMRRHWPTLIASTALILAAATPAEAHPHVWIEMQSDVVFNDQGLIQAVNLTWTFDDAYTQMALDGLDTNGDGVYSQPELDPLTKENMASLKDYDYFTVMRFNGEKQALSAVTEYGQIWSGNKLELHFQVPLKTPLDPLNGEFVVKVYDPDFFIAIDYIKAVPA
jgi:ABC-type uncharacterized transport system substrate-binding protein